jgi:outer membrane protein TolC
MALKNYESTKAAKNGTVNLEFKYNQTAAFAGSSASQDRTLMITYARSIYSGGAEDARSQQAYIAVEEARLERERLAQEMTKKIRDSLAEYNGQVASLRSRLMVFKGAEDAYAITKDLYAFSRSSLFELLRAQETLYSSGQKLIDSIIDRALSKYQLLFDTNQLLKLAKASKPE